MADQPIIKENSELLKKIVAEKGFSGYKHRYYWILQEVIGKNTTYEELSEENKAILHHETGLDEEKIKVMSELVYGKPEPTADDADAEEKPLQTKIGFILSFLPYRKSNPYKPLPEEKKLNPLEEYIALLSLSLDMLKLREAKNPFVEFRSIIKDFLQNRYQYDGAFYNGLLSLFDGNVVVDLTMFDIAYRMDKSRNRLSGPIGPFFMGHFNAIKEYNEYNRFGRAYKDMDQFCQESDYVALNFPDRDIKTFLASDKIYAELHSQLTGEMWCDINTAEINEHKERVLQLSADLKAGKIPNTGIWGDWKTTLSARLKELKKDLDNSNVKSRQGKYSDKMRLYMLKKLADPMLEGAKVKSPNHRLYAAILNSNADIIRMNSQRIESEDRDLGYKFYRERAENIMDIYRLVEDINDDAHKKEIIIESIIQDLIPVEKTKKKSLETLEEYPNWDEKIKKKVRDAINEYYDN